MTATTVLACIAVIAWAAIAIGVMWWGQVGIAIGCIREGVPAWWRGFKRDFWRAL